jgi:predicted DNA-binding mobile mystery protein A
MNKQIVRDQYWAKVDQLIDTKKISRPVEGWIRTLRKSLGMSSPQLAVRLVVSKSQASQMERMEIEDRITLKQLRRVADVLECDLQYALVPRKPVMEMVRDRASLKAKNLVKKVHIHMALESQELPDEKLQEQVEIETDRLMREMPRDLWED